MSEPSAAWEGRPARLRAWRPADLVFVPVGLLWAAAGAMLVLLGFVEDIPLLVSGLGGLWALFGLWLLGGRMVHGAWRLARTRYRIDEAGLEIRTGSRRRVLVPDALPPLAVRTHRDGTGTLWTLRERDGRRPALREALIERVPEPRRVKDHLDALREAGQSIS